MNDTLKLHFSYVGIIQQYLMLLHILMPKVMMSNATNEGINLISKFKLTFIFTRWHLLPLSDEDANASNSKYYKNDNNYGGNNYSSSRVVTTVACKIIRKYLLPI